MKMPQNTKNGHKIQENVCFWRQIDPKGLPLPRLRAAVLKSQSTRAMLIKSARKWEKRTEKKIEPPSNYVRSPFPFFWSQIAIQTTGNVWKKLSKLNSLSSHFGLGI